jgi:hypothetical protein
LIWINAVAVEAALLWQMMEIANWLGECADGADGAPARAVKLRDRSEECRALASIMTSTANAACYLRLAATYDGLAEQQEKLARDILKFDIKTTDDRAKRQ